MPEKIKTNIYYITVALLLAAGIILRILFYAYGRPFWNDESALAINLAGKSFWELFQPLVHEQVTPPLYAVLCKFCGLFTDKAEYAYRLPSLICGIASLPLFLAFAEKTLNNKIGKIFATALFALNYQLIYYSQELKQYSCDVLLFLGVLVSYFYIDRKKFDRKLFVLIGLFYAVSIWFSYTSLFAMFVVFLLCFIRKEKALTIFGIPALSFGVFLFYIKNYATSEALHNFWDNGFIALNFSNFPLLIFNNIVFYFPDFSWRIFVVLMFAAGLIYTLKYIKYNENIILLTPVLLAVLLSYLHIYPMYIRTALYLLPVVFLIMAKTFEPSFFYKKEGKIIAGILALFFAAYTFKTDFTQILQKKYYRETTPELLQLYKREAKNTDILIVPHLTAINYEYYVQRTSLPAWNAIVITPELYEYDKVKEIYNTLPSGSYYVLFTHSGDKNLEFESLKKYALSQKNPKISSDEYNNALIYFQKQ